MRLTAKVLLLLPVRCMCAAQWPQEHRFARPFPFRGTNERTAFAAAMGSLQLVRSIAQHVGTTYEIRTCHSIGTTWRTTDTPMTCGLSSRLSVKLDAMPHRAMVSIILILFMRPGSASMIDDGSPA